MKSEDQISLARLPPDSGIVPITPKEEANWLALHGQITTLTRDGIRYRIIDPWERGDEASSE